MSQINKYADKAAYEADAARLKTLSSESYIENDGELIYDGVNTVIRKSAAGVGDLVVFDKTDSTLKFIKGDTLVTEKIPPQLIPVAVVYARQGDRVLIVSLENATVGSQRWAYSYEVALSGFDLAAGGTAVLSFGQGIYAMELPITYAAGASLADIAAQINANATVKSTYGWTASATCYGSNTTFRTSCEHNYALAFVYNGYTGNLNGNYKYNTYFVRTVSAL